MGTVTWKRRQKMPSSCRITVSECVARWEVDEVAGIVYLDGQPALRFDEDLPPSQRLIVAVLLESLTEITN